MIGLAVSPKTLCFEELGDRSCRFDVCILQGVRVNFAACQRANYSTPIALAFLSFNFYDDCLEGLCDFGFERE